MFFLGVYVVGGSYIDMNIEFPLSVGQEIMEHEEKKPLKWQANVYSDVFYFFRLDVLDLAFKSSVQTF